MFKLPQLPYAYDALEPVISAETMGFHHDKHHAKYVETLNKLLDEAAQAPTDLEGVVLKTEHAPEKVKLFDNAGEHFDEAQRYVVARVRERPLTATLAGLGVGLLLGLLLANRSK